MFDSPYLDLALVLAFLYLVLSLLVSAVNEIILSYLQKSRALRLEETIKNFLFDPQWKIISDKIFESPFIKTLKQKEEAKPSYIPARNFTLALIDIIKTNQPAGLTTLGLNELEKIRAIINAPDSIFNNSDFKQIINGLLDSSQGNLKAFENSVNKLYDDLMDRATGWYKKQVQFSIAVIAFIITVSFNIDSIFIVNKLWQDKTALSLKADKYTAVYKNMDNKDGVISINDSVFNYKSNKYDTLVKITKSATSDSVRKDTIITKSIKNETTNAKNMQNLLVSMGLPIGWNKENLADFKCSCKGGNTLGNIWSGILKFLGFIISTLAIYQGAPFWFDLLNKIVSVRATGKKPKDNDSSE